MIFALDATLSLALGTARFDGGDAHAPLAASVEETVVALFPCLWGASLAATAGVPGAFGAPGVRVLSTPKRTRQRWHRRQTRRTWRKRWFGRRRRCWWRRGWLWRCWRGHWRWRWRRHKARGAACAQRLRPAALDAPFRCVPRTPAFALKRRPGRWWRRRRRQLWYRWQQWLRRRRRWRRRR